MNRLTTIDVDNISAHAPPTRWTSNHVGVRIIEAYRIEARLPRDRRNTLASLWPAVSNDFADKIHWTDARDRVLQAWENTSAPVPPADVTRMNQAHEWLRVYLTNHETERMCLSQWAAALAYRRSIRAILKRKRWARTTFYRHVQLGCLVITASLTADDVPVS